MESLIAKRFTKEQITELKTFYNEFKDHKWNSEGRQACLRRLMSDLDLSEKQIYTFCKNKKSRDKKKEIKNVMKQSNIRIPQTAKQCASVLSQQMRELFSEMRSDVTSSDDDSSTKIKRKECFFDTFFQNVKRPKVDPQESEDLQPEAMSGDSMSCFRDSSNKLSFRPTVDSQAHSGCTSSTSSPLSSPKSMDTSLPSLRMRNESNAPGLSRGNNTFLPLPSALLNTAICLPSSHNTNSNVELEMQARSILTNIVKDNCLFNPLTDHQSRSLPVPNGFL